MGSEGIGLDANPQQSKAFWALLHAAIERAGTYGVIGETGEALESAAVTYANSLPKQVKEMIARKAAEK